MENFWKIAGYIATALAIFIAGWQLSTWIRGENVHIKEVRKTDTLYVAMKIPDTIEKIVYKDRVIRRIDTVHNIIEREKIIEYTRCDTVYYPINPRWQLAIDTISNSNILELLRQDNQQFKVNLPQIVSKEREWWQDLIYLTGTAAVTYGITRIE